jgi:virginiamycin A acetyltransferase
MENSNLLIMGIGS